jgi:hypothetical protein
MRTAPVNQAAGPLTEGWDPLRMIFMMGFQLRLKQNNCAAGDESFVCVRQLNLVAPARPD